MVLSYKGIHKNIANTIMIIALHFTCTILKIIVVRLLQYKIIYVTGFGKIRHLRTKINN